MKNSEQPAFPSQDPTVDFRNGVCLSGGLSKLEYFAGLAMQGLLANGEIKKETDAAFKFVEEKGELKNDIPFVYASMAMDFAKALLTEIEKETANQNPQQ